MTTAPAKPRVEDLTTVTQSHAFPAHPPVRHTDNQQALRATLRDHATERNFDHESLWSLMCRRLSFATYRRTARYHRQLVVAPQRGMADHILPVPLLADTIAVYLSSHLPTWLIARLGHGGLCRAAGVIETVCKTGARAAKLILSPAFSLIRWLRHRRAAKAAHAARLAGERRFISSQATGRRLHVLLDGRIAIEAAQFSPTALYLSMRAVRDVTEPIQIFAHVYPEDVSTLPADRQEHRYYCKDHNPLIDPSRWPRREWYRDETWLGDLPPGYYRVEVGVINRQTFRKFGVGGTTSTSIDLGWVRIGEPQEALR